MMWTDVLLALLQLGYACYNQVSHLTRINSWKKEQARASRALLWYYKDRGGFDTTEYIHITSNTYKLPNNFVELDNCILYFLFTYSLNKDA